MYTDTTPKEKPTGSTNIPAGQTDSQIVPIPAGAGNYFANLTSRFTLARHTFTRINEADGAEMYYAARWGMSRVYPDLQAAAHFLAQIGGGNV